jgi:hypothetical protein
MKRILSFILIATLTISIFAQLPVNKKTDGTSKVKDLGTAKPGDVIPFNPNLKDTLPSNDTLFYKVMVSHDIVVFPYESLLLKKVAGSDTSVITVTYWQSVDGKTNWQQVLSTTTPSAFSYSWTKALQKTGGVDIDGWRSVVWFRSQYFGARYISSTVSGYKGIYYGSFRFDKN